MTGREVLLQEFRAGSESALDRVMSLYLKPLTFFATKIIGVQAVAEEIVSDSFVTLYQRRGNFHALPAIKSFLYLSTRNACLNYLKSSARKHTLIQAPLATGSEVEFEQRDTLTRMIYAELIQSIYEEIAKLPEQQGVIFRLSFFDGWSISEIAEQLNISTNAVKLGRSRAKKNLKAVFGKRDLFILLTFLKFSGLG